GWQQLNFIVGGSPPAARMRCSMVVDSSGLMYMYGGRRQSGTPLGDLWQLKRVGNVWQWSRVFPQGDPVARFGHTAVIDTADQGGVLKNDVWALWVNHTTGAARWESLTVSGSGQPLPRTRHAATWDPTGFHPPVYDRMLMFGGERSGSSAASDSAWGLTLTAN